MGFSLVSNNLKNYGRRHFKIFSNFHVLWDTLYNRWQRRICTHSVQLYSYVTSVNLVVVFDKIINNSDNFRIKCYSDSEISAILCVLYFLILHFFYNLENIATIMCKNFFFLVIIDTCDVHFSIATYCTW